METTGSSSRPPHLGLFPTDQEYDPATVNPRYNEPGYNENPCLTKIFSRPNLFAIQITKYLTALNSLAFCPFFVISGHEYVIAYPLPVDASFASLEKAPASHYEC
jgi:hypothetical protein